LFWFSQYPFVALKDALNLAGMGGHNVLCISVAFDPGETNQSSSPRVKRYYYTQHFDKTCYP